MHIIRIFRPIRQNLFMNLINLLRLPYTQDMYNMYFRGAQAAIVVYDITNADTFARAKTWVRELQRQVSIIKLSFAIRLAAMLLFTVLTFNEYCFTILFRHDQIS